MAGPFLEFVQVPIGEQLSHFNGSISIELCLHCPNIHEIETLFSTHKHEILLHPFAANRIQKPLKSEKHFTQYLASLFQESSNSFCYECAMICQMKRIDRINIWPHSKRFVQTFVQLELIRIAEYGFCTHPMHSSMAIDLTIDSTNDCTIDWMGVDCLFNLFEKCQKYVILVFEFAENSFDKSEWKVYVLFDNPLELFRIKVKWIGLSCISANNPSNWIPIDLSKEWYIKIDSI